MGSPSPCHVLGDRGLTNVDAKLKEFSMDPGSTLQRVGQAHGSAACASTLVWRGAKIGRSGWFAKRLAQGPSEGHRRGAESRHHPEPVRSETGVERARGKRQQRRWGTDADGAIER